jgi:N-acetylglucosamine-6-phosphate deacetylase
MIVLSGAELVLPDRILAPGTLVLDGSRIADIRPGAVQTASAFSFQGHFIVPGFVDVHVHGVDGVDTLQPGEPIASMAARMPRYGVAAFCPTTIACAPDKLRRVLEQVGRERAAARPGTARVLPAHLESNFLNPEFRGAQPAACLRSPRAALDAAAVSGVRERGGGTGVAAFDAGDILREIERASLDVGIVTLAPELDGALDLVDWLLARNHRVSLGHSGADYDEAQAAIAAGARHATHLFNRMPPLDHRAPGLVGAILDSEQVAAELICDGYHVHPALVRATVAAKRPSRVLAITDGTAASGLPPGSIASIGDETITAGSTTALLPDGTVAGSLLTMDGAFRTLVQQAGVSLVDAATMCATTPSRELGLVGHGMLVVDGVADIVILDQRLSVVQTYIGGQLAYVRA